MPGRRRLVAEETTSTRYRGADGRWHGRVTMGTRLDGRPDRRHVSRKTKAELDQAVRALERARDRGQYAWTKADPTLGQWLDHWLENVIPTAIRWKTLSTYRSQMRLHVIPALGPMRLSDVRAEVLEQHYRRMLDAGRSPALVHAVYRVLRSALNEAVRRAAPHCQPGDHRPAAAGPAQGGRAADPGGVPGDARRWPHPPERRPLVRGPGQGPAAG